MLAPLAVSEELIPLKPNGNAAAITPVYQTIDEAIAKGDLADVRRHLIVNPRCLNQGAGENSHPPIEQAVQRNKQEIALFLLTSGANPNTSDASKRTPLHHAAAKNQLATAKALLDGGADPMTLSQLGGTALHEVAASGGKEIILLLLENKVDPTVKSKEGATALDIAKKYKNQSAVNVPSELK